ncbi:MAG: hypothetical protein RIG62_08760 [Cyclobacteriaceae bacterium]
MRRGISDFIEGWRLTLDAARTNTDITKDLAKQGYNGERIDEGIALLTTVKAGQQEYQNAIGDQCNATDALQKALEAANSTYMYQLKLARLAIPQDRDLWRTLKLNGRREKSFSGWLEQTEAFYANAPQALPLLKPHGITVASLEQAKAQIQAVMDARVKQTHSKGTAQVSKQQRDESIADLRAWMQDFIRTAKFVYAKNPQQLESLGIVVAS